MLKHKKTPLGRSGVDLNFQAPISVEFCKNLYDDLKRIAEIDEDFYEQVNKIVI